MTSTAALQQDATASAVEVAQRIADEVLAPTAQDVDRSSLVDAERFDALASAGLFGIAGPTELGEPGRADLDARTMRRVMAAIASGCGATFFVWAQHHGVVRTIRSCANAELRDRLLAPLCSGSTIGGTAFAHLRRADRRAVTATSIDGGWRLDGFAPWATSWGIAEVFTVAAESNDGRVVWSLIEGREQPGLDVVPLELPVFGATGTVALRFDGLIVSDERILGCIEDADAWRTADRQRAAIGQTGVLGVAARAISLLRESARDDGDQVHDTAEQLRRELADKWAADDELLHDLLTFSDSASADLARASDHRARCLDLGHRSTTALLAAVGGGGMNLAHPAQRLAREAAFYVIQAQTTDGRAATLRSAAQRPSGS